MGKIKITLATLFATLLSACQMTNGETDPSAVERPARLANLEAENMSALKAALSASVGRTNIEVAPIDLETSTSVSVLPAPLGTHETHSVAMPTVFNLVLKADKCFAVQQDSETEIRLDGVKCLAAE